MRMDRVHRSAGVVAALAMALAVALPAQAWAADPAATTGSALNVEPTSALLSGTADSGGEPASVYFEYATDADYSDGGYSDSTPAAFRGLKLGPIPGLPVPNASEVAHLVEGLSPATIYHFRLVVVQNACLGTPLEESCPQSPVTARGEDVSFRTTAPPAAATLDATGVENGVATVNASVNPNGLATTYRFEWGTSTSYGNSAPVPGRGAGNGTSDQTVSETLADLVPGTEYHYRIVAINDAGETVGEDATFTTSSVPVAASGQADEVTATGARLNGTANAQNGPGTAYEFEYCEEAEFDPDAGSCTTSKSTQAREVQPSDAEDHAVSETLADGTLQPATTYRFRLVVTNASDTVEGSYGQFTTSSLKPPGGAPIAVTGDATSIGTKTATLSGLVDPNGLATTYRFEYGTSPSHLGASSPAGSLGSDSEPQEVARALSGLKPRTKYYFRLVAENEAGKTIGESHTFTTGPQPGKKGGSGP